MLGEKLQYGTIESEQSIQLDVSNLKNGVYIVNFVSDDRISRYTKRIIKN